MSIIDFHIGLREIGISSLAEVQKYFERNFLDEEQHMLSDAQYKADVQPSVHAGDANAVEAALRKYAHSGDLYISRPKFVESKVPLDLKLRKQELLKKIGLFTLSGDDHEIILHLFVESHFSHLARYTARGNDLLAFTEIRPSWLPLVSAILSLCSKNLKLCVWNMERNSRSETAFVRYVLGKIVPAIPLQPMAKDIGKEESLEDLGWSLAELDEAYAEDLYEIHRMGILMDPER